MSVYRAPLYADLQEDSDEDVDELPSFLMNLEERRWRGEQINRIKAFLESAAERETDLTYILDWLTEAQESLQEFEEKKERQEGDDPEVTSEWIVDMERKLDMSMSNMDGCIHRLRHLCRNLFDIDVKKTKKKEATLNKGGVWRWWREQKVDARTIKRIQELQPPTADVFLVDVNLATKSSTELSFMLLDIAKSLALNKALNMAFKFVTMGLQNLNQAFQERTKEAQKHLAQVEELMLTDARFELAQMKIQLGDSQVKVSKLQKELMSVKEQNEALLFQIRQMQETPKPPKPPVPKQERMFVAPKKPEEPTPTDLTDQPANKPATKLRLPRRRTKPKEDQPIEHVPDAPDDYDSLEDMSTIPEDIIEQVEKKSIDLLEDFQDSVFKIIERCVTCLPGNQDEEGQDAASRKDKASDIIKLYCVLQRTIRDSFDGMIKQLQGKFTDDIIDLPPMDDQLAESEFWDSSQKSPGDMLKEISKEIKQHDRTVKDVGANMRAIFGVESNKKTSVRGGQSRRHSIGFLMDQFKSINDMGKKQVCKMRLTLESLVEMHGKMSGTDKPEVASEEGPSAPKINIYIPSPEDSSEEPEVEEIEVVKEQVGNRTRRRSILVHHPQKLIPLNMAKSGAEMDHVDRYSAEMEEEEQRLMHTHMGTKHVIDVESQRTNLTLLQQAVVNRHISPELYSMVKDLIIETLSSIELRLACLFQRFIKLRALQHARNKLNARLLFARDMSDGQSIKDLSTYLQKLSVHESKILRQWSAKQANIDVTRNTCIARMLYLFSQLRVDYNLHLASAFTCHTQELPHPVLTVVPRKLQWSLRPRYSCSLKPPPALAIPLPPQPSALAHLPTPVPPQPSTAAQLSTPLPLQPYPRNNRVREIALGQSPTLWQADKTLRCMWLARKLPAQPSFMCNIPRLLELDTNKGRINALRTLQARMDGVLDQILLGRGDDVRDQE